MPRALCRRQLPSLIFLLPSSLTHVPMELYDLPSPPLFVDQPLSPDLLADERDEAVDMTEVEEPYIPVVVIVEDQDDDNGTVSDVASEPSTLNDEDDLSQAMVGIEQSMSEDEMQEYLDFLNSMPWEDDVFPTLKNPFNFYKYNERVCAPLEVVAIDSYGFVTTYIDYRDRKSTRLNSSH